MRGLLICAVLVSSASAVIPPSGYPVKAHVFDAVVDHFNFRPTTVPTYPMRYYVNDDHWNASTGQPGPVFFYAGNEADIFQFINNSGFMFEAAAEFGALVVFAEHRYYGLSNPFGQYALDVPYNVSFLSVEQAMEDFNTLNVHLREAWRLQPDTAFVVFGGSYGANLALWLRLKNPNLWAGAVASSATPLKHVLRQTNAFARIETEAYGNVSSRCPQLIRAGWAELFDGASTAAGRAIVGQKLGLCHALPDESAAQDVHGWASGALETMVQYGYPYPTAFYNPVPAFPFKVACMRMQEAEAIEKGELHASPGLAALRAAVGVYYNFTGQAGPCFDFGSGILGGAAAHWTRMGQHDRLQKLFRQRSTFSDVLSAETQAAWGYQCCTEVYQPMPTDGVTDFEVPHAPNETAYFDSCRQRWGVEPRPTWEEMTFMGSDIGAGSNIFITNGQLDPWRAAGIQAAETYWNPTVVVRIIEGAAHHLDLRAANPLDPPSVVAVREEERAAIRRWMGDWAKSHPRHNNIIPTFSI